MAADFYIKQNDLLPDLTATCINEDTGNAEDVSGAGTIVFSMRKPGAPAPKIDKAIASFVTDGINGQIKYVWQSGDTDETGEFDAEFELTFADNKTLTYPNWGQFIVKITGDVS